MLGAGDLLPAALARAVASSAARSTRASARASASAAALGTSVADFSCAESIAAEVEAAVDEAMEASPAAASIIDGRDMVSIALSAADGSDVAAMDVDVEGAVDMAGQGVEVTQPSAVPVVSSSAALSPHVDTTSSTAALATPLGKNGSHAGVVGAGREDGGDAKADEEDILDSDEDSDDQDSDEDSDNQFVNLKVDLNKWSLQYLYDVFQGLGYCDVWKDSMVTFNKTGKLTAHVTRRPTDRLLRYLAWINRDEDPKASFTVYSNSGTLLYARRCDFGGIQLVHVIGLDEPRENDWSETMRFVRLFPTMDAITNCESNNNNGQFLGKKALREFWKSVNHPQKSDVYHQGDVDFKGDVRELIGVARWYPFGQEQPAASYFPDCKSADLVYMGPPFSLKTSKRRNTNGKGKLGGASGGGV